jgi:hypothetical protein
MPKPAQKLTQSSQDKRSAPKTSDIHPLFISFTPNCHPIPKYIDPGKCRGLDNCRGLSRHPLSPIPMSTGRVDNPVHGATYQPIHMIVDHNA